MIFRISLSVFALFGFISASSFAAEEQSALQDTRDFLVAGGDGYGTSDCLATLSSCGAIVANAWCESKGFTKSVKYRVANKDETTATVKGPAIDQAFVITCSAK